MRGLFFLPLYLVSHSVLSQAQDCLNQSRVDAIIDRWRTVYEKRNPQELKEIINNTVTEDVVATDNGYNFLFGTPTGGALGPYATNRQEFYKANSPITSLVHNQTINTTTLEFNCASITFRWEGTAIAAGNSSQNLNNYAEPNTRFSFRGTDLLHIRSGTDLIAVVQSSSDYLNYLYAAGVPVAFRFGTAPKNGTVEVNYPAPGY